MSWCCPSRVLAEIRHRRAGPPQAQPRPDGRRAGACSPRCGGCARPTSTWNGTSSTTWSPTPPRSSMFVQRLVAAGHRDRRAGPAGRPGPGPRGCPAGLLSNAECELLSRQLRRPGRAARLDGRRRGAAGRAGAPARPAARAGGAGGLAVPRLRLRGRRGGHHGRPAGRPPGGGPVRNCASTTYAHILVDEAQDITPMQWRMLRRRGPSASWTIVGDPAQSSWPDAEEAERAMTEMVGHRAGPPVPDEHQLPQPGRGVRPGRRRWCGRPTRRPTCPRPCGRPGSTPSWRSPARTAGRRRPPTQVPRLLAEVEGTVGVIVPQPLLADADRGADRGRRSAVGTGPGGQPDRVQGPGVRRGAGGRPRPDRGHLARRRPRALRRADPADPAAGHARRRSWCRLA